MKRTLLAVLLGLTAVSQTCGQGHVLFSNYVTPPYYPVVWYPGGPPVTDTAFQIQLYYGEGVITQPELLTAGVIATISDVMTEGGGWFSGLIQILPAWQDGDVYTFAMRGSISGVFGNWSAVWQESDAINPIMSFADVFQHMPQYAFIPEPSSLALVCTTVLCLSWAQTRKVTNRRGGTATKTKRH